MHEYEQHMDSEYSFFIHFYVQEISLTMLSDGYISRVSKFVFLHSMYNLVVPLPNSKIILFRVTMPDRIVKQLLGLPIISFNFVVNLIFQTRK